MNSDTEVHSLIITEIRTKNGGTYFCSNTRGDTEDTGETGAIVIGVIG